MAQGAAKDTVFKIDNPAGTSVDISADITSVTFTIPKNAIDVTTFGDNYRDYLSGLADATISLDGVYDPASGKAGSIFAVVANGTATQSLSWEYHPQGTASGKPKFSGECYLTSFSPGGGLDNAVTWSAQLQNTGAVTVANN